MSKETKTVHFRVGEDAGILLTTIAQEHLLYDFNPVKALATITDSLMGCPPDLALKLIKGDFVLMVDVDKQEFLLGEYDASIHAGIFPRLDIDGFVTRKTKDIYEGGKGLDTAINMMANQMKYGRLTMTFDYGTVLKYVNGEKEPMLRMFEEDEKVNELTELVLVTKAYIERSLQYLSVIHYMKRTWPEEFAKGEYDIDIHEAKKQLQFVTDELVNLFRTDFGKAMRDSVEAAADVYNYIKAAIEIDEVVKKGIEPVDIMENWSAGWLAPNGDYYALNGEIANMLHNRIATALYDKGGIIPESEENQNNPDGWLMENGWCRIHGSNVLYDGYYGHTYDHMKVIPMTSEQVRKITGYGQACHGGRLKLGFQDITAAMFEMLMESGSPQIWEKYLA